MTGSRPKVERQSRVVRNGLTQTDPTESSLSEFSLSESSNALISAEEWGEPRGCMGDDPHAMRAVPAANVDPRAQPDRVLGTPRQ